MGCRDASAATFFLQALLPQIPLTWPPTTANCAASFSARGPCCSEVSERERSPIEKLGLLEALFTSLYLSSRLLRWLLFGRKGPCGLLPAAEQTCRGRSFRQPSCLTALQLGGKVPYGALASRGPQFSLVDDGAGYRGDGLPIFRTSPIPHLALSRCMAKKQPGVMAGSVAQGHSFTGALLLGHAVFLCPSASQDRAARCASCASACSWCGNWCDVRGRISSCCFDVGLCSPFAGLVKAWSQTLLCARLCSALQLPGLLGSAELLYEFISGSDGMSPRDAGRHEPQAQVHAGLPGVFCL